MKTYTITLHSTDNCGSSLQAYALQQFLTRNGVENKIIDYVPSYIKYNGHKFRYVVKKALFYRTLNSRQKRFDSFKTEYLSLSEKTYKSFKELCDAKLKADCFITGSDQLWNSMFACGHDPAYYLEFTSSNKIGYAVSIGENSISGKTEENIHKYANNFSWVSLREKESIESVQKLIDCPVEYACDPVLLNGTKTYDQIIDQRLIEEKYCVVYLAQSIDIDLINALIDIIRNELKCKIILIGSIIKHCKCDIHIKDAGPSQFLSLIKYSDFVISDSFHATVFSVIYKKQFLVAIPQKNGVRIDSFLKMVGLQNRRITSLEERISDITDEEYTEAHEAINRMASESGKKLLTHLSKL